MQKLFRINSNFCIVVSWRKHFFTEFCKNLQENSYPTHHILIVPLVRRSCIRTHQI